MSPDQIYELAMGVVATVGMTWAALYSCRCWQEEQAREEEVE